MGNLMVRRPEIGQEVTIWHRGWLAPQYTVRRDPLSVGVAVLVNIGWTGAISGVGATILGSVILGAAAFGLSLLSNAIFSPGQQERPPSERQATVRQSVGPRVRFYGRVKVGGTLWFFESKDGLLFSAVTLNEGKISGVVEYWLNDQQVILDVNSKVQDAPYAFIYEGLFFQVASLFVKDGDTNQTVHSLLDFYFPEITTEHRFRGTANYLSIFQEVAAEKIPEVYPQLNPNVRMVIDASLVKDVRTGTVAWSDNAANAIYDYLSARDGADFPYGAGYQESQINLTTFQAFANLSDQLVAKKAGGFIKRYRIWGGYSLAEEMRVTLPRMLRACDAELYLDPDGKIAIRGGQWVEPTLTLDATKGHIITANLYHGTGSLAAFNELTLVYTEPDLDYQENEGETWIDAANLALRGRPISSKLDLLMVPDHAQARRLAKIHTHRSNPEWVGTIVTNFYGFNAIHEESVHLVFPLLNIDDDFSIRKIRIMPDMTGVELTIASLSSSAFDWDPELEEGAGPTDPPDTSTPITLDPPADFHVSAAERDLGGGSTGVFLIATWTEPERVALAQEVEYRTSGTGTWVQMLVSDGVGLAESGLVADGVDYDFRARTRSPAGQYGDYTSTIIVTATPDTSAPDPVDNVVGTAGVGQVQVDFDMSPDDNAIGAFIYRNTVSTFGTATLIATLYGSPGTAQQFMNTGLSAGTYYYWVVAFNGSGFIPSTETATGAQVVT